MGSFLRELLDWLPSRVQPRLQLHTAPDPASPTKAEPLPIFSVQQHVDPVRGDHHPQPGHVPRGTRLLRAHQHLSRLPRPGPRWTRLHHSALLWSVLLPWQRFVRFHKLLLKHSTHTHLWSRQWKQHTANLSTPSGELPPLQLGATNPSGSQWPAASGGEETCLPTHPCACLPAPQYACQAPTARWPGEWEGRSPQPQRWYQGVPTTTASTTAPSATTTVSTTAPTTTTAASARAQISHSP